MWRRALAGATAFLGIVAFACGKDYADEADAAAPIPDAAAETSEPTPIVDASDVEDAADASDASVPDQDADAAVPAPHCAPTKPFGAPVRVGGIPLGAGCGRLTDDESIIAYSYGDETRIAARVGANLYGAPTTMSTTGPKPHCATFSRDRAVVFYDGNFGVSQESGPAGGPYGARTVLASSAAHYVSSPYFDFERSLLYANFHLETAYFGAITIGVAEVNGGTVGPFSQVGLGLSDPQYDAGPDDAGPRTFQDIAPVISSDGLELFFASTRTPDGPTDNNIWHTTRDSLTTPFHNAAPLATVNTITNDAPSWISPDGCRLYLFSARDTPDGGFPAYAVFVATREP